MPTIAIVDDRPADRETIRRVVASTLRQLGRTDTWSVVTDDPPKDQADVVSWLDENDAAVLVTDWRLNEGAKDNRAVAYEADALIAAIRSRRPEFPIYVITGFESEARGHLSSVENVFSRDYFADNAAVLVPQMLARWPAAVCGAAQVAGTRRRAVESRGRGRCDHAQREELSGLHGYFAADLPTFSGRGFCSSRSSRPRSHGQKLFGRRLRSG